MPISRLTISPLMYTAFIVAITIGVSSCGKSTTTDKNKEEHVRGIVLGGLLWRHSGSAADTLDKAWFAKTVHEVMERQSLINQTNCAFRIEGGIETTGGEGTLVIEARVTLEKEKMVLHSGVSATGGAADSVEAEQLIRKGLKEIGNSITDQLVLLNGDRQRWVDGLDASEPDIQVLALRLIGNDKNKEAVPAVARLLEDPREQVAEVAAETLAQIGDRRAVPLLISSIGRGNLRSEVRAIEAMAKIGGEEAQAYIEMIALGHEVPEVRNLAVDLLKRVNSR